MTTSHSTWLRLATIASLLFGTALLLILWNGSSNENGTTTISTRRNLGSTEDCETQCKDPTFKDLQHFGGDDLLHPENMLERLKRQRGVWVNQRLKSDYGADVYQNIFEPLEGSERVSVGRNRFFKDVHSLHVTKMPDEEVTVGAHEGWERLVRKMKMKIIQLQISMLEERQNAKAICLDECDANDEDSSRFLKVAPSTGLYGKFTWATGGHSASAGHGNFFRDSYTSRMELALKPLFTSIGLDFEARNYAMGGTDSAEEVALCMNQIFGKDIDFISWDYGMTDGHDIYKMTMYAYKAAGISRAADSFSMPVKIPHRPAFFAMHQNPGNNLVVEVMHDLGMTALAMDTDYMHNVILDAIPDMFGLNDQQIQKQPPLVQYLKCGGGIETGEPGCQLNKYNNTVCEQRKAKVSWHPGWKYHALVGNLMAMTFLDATEDALHSLIKENAEAGVPDDENADDAKKRLIAQLRALDGKEKQDYDNIFTSPIPEAIRPYLAGWWGGEKAAHLSDVDMEAFFKEPSFCHSAILPSQARFHGFVTENTVDVGEILDQNYEEGFSSNSLMATEHSNRKDQEKVPVKSPAGDDQILMVRDDSGRQNCKEEYLNLDYKDYFFVSNIEGWRSVTLPNKSEMKAYTEFDGKKSKGYVLACLVRCDWGKCPTGDLHNHFGWVEAKPGRGQTAPTPEELAKIPKIEITVNGEPVTEASDMHTCFALKNKNGHVFKPNAEGKYEVKMKIAESPDYYYLRISAFVIV